jgi:hypothetical protein
MFGDCFVARRGAYYADRAAENASKTGGGQVEGVQWWGPCQQVTPDLAIAYQILITTLEGKVRRVKCTRDRCDDARIPFRAGPKAPGPSVGYLGVCASSLGELLNTTPSQP